MQLWIQTSDFDDPNRKTDASKMSTFFFELYQGLSISSISLMSYPKKRTSSSSIMTFFPCLGPCLTFWIRIKNDESKEKSSKAG
jgi:hypothetical protein